MKIVRLTTTNVKRLSAVQIDPDGAAVIIGGRNGQGKSSVLDSIEYAIGGGNSLPEEPIHRGERRASIVLDLGELVVERSFSISGAPQLVVKNAKGVKQKRPQSILDSLCSSVTFDPLEYMRMDGRNQLATLRELSGVDTSALDDQREELFEQRKEKNREKKDAVARLEAMEIHKDAPKKEVQVAELLGALGRIHAEINENGEKRREYHDAVDCVENSSEVVEDAKDLVKRIEGQLREAKADLAAEKKTLKSLGEEAERLKAEVEALVDPNPEEIEEKISTAEETNRKVLRNSARADLAASVEDLTGEIDVLNDGLTDIEGKKAKALAEAEMPLEGLSFDSDGVTLDEIPLAQSSQAEQLRLSVAIGFALNPKLRVMLVRDGSLLDSESMRLLAELAEKHEGQLWIERVGDGDPGAIIIEDGSVLESEDEEESGV